MKPHPRFHAWLFGVAVSLIVVNPASAGMASFELKDIVFARLESISFFALIFLAFTLVLKLAWNYLQRDFINLPRLSFFAALAITLATGLFFAVVLTMISGARELMTPGAWNHVGNFYELKSPKQDPDQWLDSARIKALERLRAELWKYSESHLGYLPTSRFVGSISDQAWQGIAPDSSHYCYWGGLKAGEGSSIVAYEGNVYGPERYVLRANGTVSLMKAEELSKEFKEQMDAIFTAKTAKDGSEHSN